MTNRRTFLEKGSHLCAGALAGGIANAASGPTVAAVENQKFLLIGLCGSENPTRANFPFVWAAACGTPVMKSVSNWLAMQRC